MHDDRKKLQTLIPHWLAHNREHIKKGEEWLPAVTSLGSPEAVREYSEFISLFREANRHLENAHRAVGPSASAEASPHPAHEPHHHGGDAHEPYVHFKPIGFIRTPYTEHVPFRPREDAEGDFRIVLDPRFQGGLHRLDEFSHLHVLFLLDRAEPATSLEAHPPGAGITVGTFASRSPRRPNPIGLSVVRVKKIEGNEIHITGLDALDGTPLLDIKPYIRDTDSIPGANNGWIDSLDKESDFFRRMGRKG